MRRVVQRGLEPPSSVVYSYGVAEGDRIQVRLDEELAEAFNQQLAIARESDPRVSRSTLARMLLRNVLDIPREAAMATEMTVIVYADVARLKTEIVRRIRADLPEMLAMSPSG